MPFSSVSQVLFIYSLFFGTIQLKQTSGLTGCWAKWVQPVWSFNPNHPRGANTSQFTPPNFQHYIFYNTGAIYGKVNVTLSGPSIMNDRQSKKPTLS